MALWWGIIIYLCLILDRTNSKKCNELKRTSKRLHSDKETSEPKFLIKYSVSGWPNSLHSLHAHTSLVSSFPKGVISLPTCYLSYLTQSRILVIPSRENIPYYRPFCCECWPNNWTSSITGSFSTFALHRFYHGPSILNNLITKLPNCKPICGR
jgi:hypothetical protein